MCDMDLEDFSKESNTYYQLCVIWIWRIFPKKVIPTISYVLYGFGRFFQRKLYLLSVMCDMDLEDFSKESNTISCV
jgi:hypothetical protein